MPYLTGDIPEPNKFWCRLTRVPYSLGFLMVVGGALAELTKPHNWEKFGTMTPDESAEAATNLLYEWTNSNMCMIGAIVPYATEYAPENSLPCDGGTYARVDYPFLYEKLLPQYIVDANLFTTPDLRDKFIKGAIDSAEAGGGGGANEVTLLEENLASHTHGNAPHTHNDTPHTHAEGIAVPAVAGIGLDAPIPSAVPGVSVTGPASVGILPASVSIDPTGGNVPFSIMPPYAAFKYAIVAR